MGVQAFRPKPAIERLDEGVEVYERFKNRPGIATWNPLSVGIAYALIDRVSADKVPLLTINHGRTDSTDGRVFKYIFPLLLNPYSETSGIVNYVAAKVPDGTPPSYPALRHSRQNHYDSIC